VTPKLPVIDYATHPAYGGMLEPHPVFAERALMVLRPAIEEARAIEEERVQQFGYRRGHSDSVGAEIAASGVSRIQLGPPAIDRIEAAASPVLEAVTARLARTRAAGEPVKYKTAHEGVSALSHPELWAAIDETMREMGVYEIAATYFGAPKGKLRSAGVLVNQPDQDWATRLYRDIEVEAPPTAGFHIDSNGKCFVKCVLYLSDVGPEQGPFGLVAGSHLWDEGSQDRIYRRAFDKTELITRSAKKMRMFISLPKEMQVKAEFGGDMIAGSPEAEALLAQERVAVGPRGQLNLFDPEAVHRGGNVRAGERRAILITTGPAW
jgi:hypothetical protein